MKNIFYILLVLISIKSFSQTYKEDEKMFLENFKKDSIDLIKGLSLIDSTYTKTLYANNKRSLDEFILTLPSKQKTDKREKRRVKKIYDLIHKKFFIKYENDAFFNSIFSSKTYNCVTATAIYVYVFDALDIPYHIKELPSHVYLIAYPIKYKIHLETTVPGAYGFHVPKDSEIVKLIDNLIKTKLLTQKEVNEKGYNASYIEYFYGNEHISKSKLIGMQYYNKAILALTDNKLDVAFKNINKSFVFYNNPFAKAVLFSLIYQSSKDMDFSQEKNVKTIIDAFQLLEYGKDIEKDFVKGVLYKIVKDTNLEYIENLIPLFKTLKQEELREYSLNYIKRYLADKHLIKRNFDKSLLFSESLIKELSEDKNIQEMIAFAVFKKMYLSKYNENNLHMIETYIQEYTFLEKDIRLISLQAKFYAMITKDFYYAREEDKAYAYFLKFDTIMNAKKEMVQLNPEFVANIYLIAGKFYYGSNKFIKAKEVFEKGLVNYPKHRELTKKLQWTIEDMKNYKH